MQNKAELKEKIKTYNCNSIKYANFSDIDTSVAFGFFFKNEVEFKKFYQNFKVSCEKKDAFLGIEVNPPQDDIIEIENADDEGEFEMISLK